jgi:hypothetical protein
MAMVTTANAAGAEALANSMILASGGQPGKKPKNTPKPKDGEPNEGIRVPLQDMPIQDQARKLMDEDLNEATEAQQFHVSLGPHQIAHTLVEQCKAHSDYLFKAYKALQSLLLQGSGDTPSYIDIFDKVKRQRANWGQRRTICQHMQKTLNPKAKAKSKAKAKAKAKQ